MNQQITTALDAQKEENDARAEALKLDYEQKIAKLEKDVITAYENNDLEKAKMLKEKQKEAEQVVVELEKRDDPLYVEEPVYTEPPVVNAPIITGRGIDPVTTYDNPDPRMGNISIVPSNSEIRMSPAEFENLIEEILESTEPSYYPQPSYPEYAPQGQYLSLIHI